MYDVESMIHIRRRNLDQLHRASRHRYLKQINQEAGLQVGVALWLELSWRHYVSAQRMNRQYPTRFIEELLGDLSERMLCVCHRRPEMPTDHPGRKFPS